MKPIEETVEPTTPTEVLLLRRIMKLKEQLWEAGRFGPATIADDRPPMPITNEMPILKLAASSDAALEVPRGMRITTKTHGPNNLGFQYYVSEETLVKMSPLQEADMLADIQHQLVHRAADEVSKLIRNRK